jgi:hypothetical protein
VQQNDEEFVVQVEVMRQAAEHHLLQFLLGQPRSQVAIDGVPVLELGVVHIAQRVIDAILALGEV